MLREGLPHFILSQNSSLALDLSGDDNTSVIGYELNKGDNQKWIIATDKYGFYTFRNVADGKFLSTAHEPRVGVKIIGAGSPAPWAIIPVQESSGLFGIIVPGFELKLNLPDGGDVPSGTPVELQDGEMQTWKFVLAEPL